LVDASADLWTEGFGATVRGETSVATRNTTYRFKDGVCIGVTDARGETRPEHARCIGMRILGWLSEGEIHPRLVIHWQGGARAVLSGKAKGEQGSMALTSPTRSFGRVKTGSFAAISAVHGKGLEPAPPALRIPDPGSVARINLPMPARAAANR